MLSGDSEEAFDRFWAVYPQRDGGNPRKPAADFFRALVRRGVDPEEIISGARRYAASVADIEDRWFIAQAKTWLNQERWRDEYRKSAQKPRNGYAAIRRCGTMERMVDSEDRGFDIDLTAENVH